MSEVKLQRVYFTYCREYKNYFNAGNGYNTLAASDENLTRELLTEIQSLSSEAMSLGGADNFVFTFTPETSLAKGVFCASFPASDIMGRASQFQNVVYDLPKGKLELRRCVEMFWNQRIRNVRKRIDVWPDDAEKAVEENTAPIDLDALIVELEKNEEEIEAKFWDRLTGNGDEARRWQGMFSFLLEAYFRRKNAESCVYLVAPAEDVALALWGLARLLPKSVISDVSFAVREPRLYRRRTITGIDGELQKDSVDGIIRKINNGSSDDALYIADAEEGKSYGFEREANHWLKFLTNAGSYKESKDYFARINRNNQNFEIYRKEYDENFSNLPIEEQLLRLDVCYRLFSKKGESAKSAFNEIQENALLPFRKLVVRFLDIVFTNFSTWGDSDFASTLWRVVRVENAADSFVENFIDYFLKRESPKNVRPEDIIFRLWAEERQKNGSDNYFYDESKIELVNPLADYLYKKFCPDDRLSEEITLQPDTERVFLKVFQNIVKKENTLDNLKRAFVWHNDPKNFLEFVFRECGCVQWGEDAGNFVKDKMLEYCFGQDISSLSTENKGSLCVLYSSEPILLYLTEQFDPNHFDTFDYIDKWIRDFCDRGVRLDNEGSLTKWISDVKKYKNRKEYYEEMSEHFSAIIKSYKGLRDLVKTNIDGAKKSEDDIQKQLGFGNETEVFWHGGVYGNELRKKLEISAKIFRSTLRPRQDNFLYQGMIEYYELFAEEYDILKAEYTELNKDEGKFDSKLRRLDNIVKNLSPGVTLHKRFKFGKETYRTRIATLCGLLTSSENVWRVLGEGEQKKWIKCRAGFSFLKDADNLKFDLGGKVTWDIPDFQPLSKKTIALLHPGSKKKNESKKKIWIWSGIVAGVLVCAFLSIYSWKLSNNPSKAGASPAKPVPSEPTVNGQVNSVANVPKTSSGDLPETDSDFRNIEQHISEAEDKLKVRNYNDALNHCKSAKRALNDQPNAELKKKVEEIEERANSLKEQKQNSAPSEDVADGTNKPENKSDGSESHTSEEDKKSQEKDQDDPFRKE